MLWCSNTSADGAVGACSPSNHLIPDDNDMTPDDNNFMHYVLWQDKFQPVHTLSTASYVNINNAMLILDKVRQSIFSVYQINSQANSYFLFRKSHKQLI